MQAFGSRGFTDFFLEAPGIKWGIELLRDGPTPADYAHRFADEGVYGRLRESTPAHCLVDIRMQNRQRVMSSLPGFRYVTFQTDYAHAIFGFQGCQKDSQADKLSHENTVFLLAACRPAL